MSQRLDPPLAPRDGKLLQVLGIARISTEKQDERSLDDQQALYRRWLGEHCDGKYELTMIAGRGSGERLDRDEWLQAGQAVGSRRYDLVIAEDLGRIARRMDVLKFCEDAQDCDTRVFTINDHVDTFQENWKPSAVFSSLHHETHNEDTSRRIRRSLRNRFTQGGVVQGLPYGYIKPPGTTTDDQVQKDPAAEPIIEHWFSMLEAGATFAEVADMLNAEGVPPGPYARKPRWDGTMVGQVTRNPILKGVRQRNKVMTKRENSTGRRKPVKAPPSELLERNCPHLAFIEPARYDRVIAMLAERNAPCRRRKIDGRDPRKQVPKKRTRFPGQTAYCGVCGRLYVYGGHGRNAHLMCSGCREYACWNGATFPEVGTRDRVCDLVFDALETLPDFDGDLVRSIQEQQRRLDAEGDGERAAAESTLGRIDREIANVVQFVRDGGASAALAGELQRLEGEKAQAERTLYDLEQRRREPLVLPDAATIREQGRAIFKDFARDSYEFARQLRIIVPRIVVFPVRLCDCDKVVLRARFRLRLSKLVESPKARLLLEDELDRVVELDLFDPPQRAEHRLAVAAFLKAGLNYRQAAARLGITATAAQYAGELQRMMDELGIDSPYVPVTEPPADSRKIRRHLHPRYRFNPRPDAGEL